MNIKKLKINNFRSIEKLDLNLSGTNRVVCFVGENGSSKTSVLSLITEAIVSKTKLIFPNFSLENKKRYRLASLGEIRKDCEYYAVELSYSSIKGQEYNFKKLVAVRNDLPVDIYVSEIQGCTLPPEGFPIFEISSLDTLKADDDFLGGNIFLVRPSSRYEHYDYEFTHRKGRDPELEVGVFNPDEMPYPFVVAHSGNDVQTTIFNMLFDAQIGYPQSRNAFQWIAVLLQKITGKNFGNIQVSQMPHRQLMSSEVGALSNLSQGELDLLVTIVNILQQQLYIYNRYTGDQHVALKIGTALEIPGIVLIDEVDLHLHPKAQESYLKILVEFFPNVQFIITTHSPFIVRGLPSESVVVSLPSGRIFSEAFHKMDIDSITSIIFQYGGRFSDFVIEKLTEFRMELTSSSSPDLEKLKNIYRELSESEPARGELELYMASYGDKNLNQVIKGA